MRLISFTTSGEVITKCGIEAGGAIVDLHVMLGADPGWQSRVRSDSLHRSVPPIPETMRELIELGPDLMQYVSEVGSDTLAHQSQAFEAGERMVYRLDEVNLCAPLIPGKVINVGLNYSEHATEAGADLPNDWPFTTSKWPDCIVGTGDPIPYPVESTQLDIEVELGVVIGRMAWQIDPTQALDYVAGLTVCNDVSARDIQFTGGIDHKQFILGKNCRGFLPLGPGIIPLETVPYWGELELSSRVNGKLWQHGNTRDMVFGIDRLVAVYSKFFPLYPGDVISTGSPGGSGMFQDPPAFVQVGDVVEVEIEHIGSVVNQVLAPEEVPPPPDVAPVSSQRGRW